MYLFHKQTIGNTSYGISKAHIAIMSRKKQDLPSHIFNLLHSFGRNPYWRQISFRHHHTLLFTSV